LQAIFGSFVHSIWVSSFLMCSLDIVEHDKIIVVIHYHFHDVHLKFQTEIRKPHPLRQRPRDVGEIVELRYHIGVYGLLSSCLCLDLYNS
jgi:hypothetical protein